MSGIKSGLNPDLVYTKLDKLFFSIFNKVVMPNMADVTQSDIFKQDATKRAKVVTELIGDDGMWVNRSEDEDLDEGTVKTGDSRTFNVLNYARALKISKNFFDDEDWGVVAKSVKKSAQKGFLKSRDLGFDIYRGAFATHTTNDGQYIISDSHTNLNGDTVDNKLTAALSPATLKSMIAVLAEMKDQAGDITGFDAKCLLVPNKLYDYAVEITESKLKPDVSDNNVNAFSAKYNIYVKQSNRLSAAAGGSDTACYLLSGDHTITRWIRQAIQTDWVDYKTDDKNRYTFKGEFREAYGAVSYEGLVATDGTT